MNLNHEEKITKKLNDLNIKFFNLKTIGEDLYFELDIWAKPGSKVEKHSVGENGELILYIKERAIEGAANKGFIKSLSKIFSIPKSSIAISKGSKSKFKRFSFQLTFTERKNIDYYLDQLQNVVGK
ncbi:DUF167 domain-containing protein [Halobacteriovorax sp.]|uniref:DUF167 domain-containing protein n=1 Tax=Halobacteriovorax sp. TaxID=2020862 RepID=UPI0035687944